MIKILQEDTIIDVVNKINESKDKEIMLEFPFGHQILHNYLSLKIIKNKAGNKRITILTNDLGSKKIGENLGIVYSMIKDPEFFKEKSSKQEILKHNFTFIEYFIFELKKYIRRFVNFVGNKTGIESLKYYSPYDRVRKSGVLLLIMGVLTSIGMLFFIFYFAVSKTYIEIDPEIEIKTKALNVVYQEETSNDASILGNSNIVQLKKVSQVIDLSDTYKTTGIDYENTKRAKAQIEFVNELRDEQTFRPKTRLLTPDGMVFETTGWVKIPGKTTDGSGQVIFGKATGEAVARVYDEKGNFVGKKGNIGSGTFIIPGLKFNQDKIYAKLSKPATGGDDNISYIVGEDDIENAKKILEEKLKREALNSLKQKIEDDNKVNSVKYEILPIKNIIKYSDLELTNISNVKEGQKIQTFQLKGKVKVEAYIYNKNHVISILKNVVNDSLLSGTDKLMFIDENSLRMSVVLERNESPLKIKATTEVDVGISFDFNNNQNYYNQRLKTMVLGLDKKEATNILLNDPKINNVIIKNTPFFISNISGNIENIILKIKNN